MPDTPSTGDFGQFLKDATSGFDAGMEATAAARGNVVGKAMGRSQDLTGQTMKIAGAPTQTPPEPKLQNMPEAPQDNFRNPMEAFGSFGSVLAVFGSLMTRAPMTAALNAAASAIKGYHEGDQQVIQRNMEKWHVETQKALQQNQKELEAYKAAMEKVGISMQDRAAKLNALAAASRDNLTMANLQLSNIGAVEENLRARLSAGIQLQRLQQDYEIKMMLNQLRYGSLTTEQKKKNDDILTARQRTKDLKPEELQAALESVQGMRTGKQQKIIDDWKKGQESLEMPRGAFGWGSGAGAQADMTTEEKINRTKNLLANGAPRDQVLEAWTTSGGTPEDFSRLFPVLPGGASGQMMKAPAPGGPVGGPELGTEQSP